MEEEERAAQSAKLQELIRRGGPEDLQEANRLMKIMAGYDTRSKTDYRAKAAEEVGKVQQKARLLEERLEAFKPGDNMTEGDVYEELASALQSAHPKIQRMCEEESDDHEAVAKLLEINDSIHRTVERYKLMKKGDVDGAAKIARGTLGTSTGVGKNAANELSLIDFDADAGTSGGSSSNNTPANGQSNGLEDDLLGLSMGENYGQKGGISLGFGDNSSKCAQVIILHMLRETDLPGPSLLSSISNQSSAKAPTPTRSPAPSGHIPLKPDYSSFSAFNSNQSSSSKPTTPQPSLFQQQQALASSKQTQPIPQPQNADPFASLTPMRSSTPAQTPQQPQQKSIFDFSAFTSKPSQQSQAPLPPTQSADDDEWAFESALPVSTPSSNTIVVSKTSLSISLHAAREVFSTPIITLSVSFSNTTDLPITELTFMAAVTKVCLDHFFLDLFYTYESIIVISAIRFVRG